MSTPASTSAPAAEPVPTPSTPAPEAPVTPAPEAPSVPSPEATPPAPAAADQIVVPVNSEGAPDLDALSADQRKTLLFGSDEAKAKFVFEQPKAPDPAPEVVPPVEATPPTELPPAEPADETDLDPTKPFPKSVRLKDLDEKTSAFVLALNTARRVNPNVNPIDVAIAHGYDLPPDFVAPPAPPVPAPEVVDPLATSKARLAEIDVEMDKMAKGETFFGEEHAKLIRERGDLAADIATQQLRAELAQSRQQDKSEADRNARISRRETVKNDVAKEYPTANDDSSELGLELNRLFTEIQSNPQHPGRAKLAADDGPRWIVQQAEKAAVARVMKNFSVPEAKALEIVKGKPVAAVEAPGPAPVATPPVTPKPPQPQPVPRTVLVTSPGGTNAAPDAVNLSPNDILEAARANPKLRREVLFQGASGVTIG